MQRLENEVETLRKMLGEKGAADPNSLLKAEQGEREGGRHVMVWAAKEGREGGDRRRDEGGEGEDHARQRVGGQSDRGKMTLPLPPVRLQ